MKAHKILLTVTAFMFLCLQGWSIVPSAPVSKESVSEVSANSTLNKDQLRVAQMKWFVDLSVEDYSKLQGKKLNFFEKALFKANQHRMRKLLKAYDYGEPTTFSKISWLLKGLLFGPLALLLGYLFLQDDERELIKWIWFGFIGFAIIVALILLGV